MIPNVFGRQETVKRGPLLEMDTKHERIYAHFVCVRPFCLSPRE